MYIFPSMPMQTISTHDCDTAYSGTAAPGCTPDASYDRVVWNDEQSVHTHPHSLAALVRDGIDAMRQSCRSRLVLRTTACCPLPLDRLEPLLCPGESLEIAHRPCNGGNRRHLTVGINAAIRSVAPHAIGTMQDSVRAHIGRLASQIASPTAFTRHALAELDIVARQGMHFDTHGNTRDLLALWQAPFGWSEGQCRQYALSERPDERIFILRDTQRRAISGVLVSQGESTEWATVPDEQGKGHIVPLLIYANSVMLAEHPSQDVYAELRWNRSVSPALKSGFCIPRQEYRNWLLTNHVTIGDAPHTDAPDPWNTGRGKLGDGTAGAMLRSFVVGHMERERFTDEILDAYLHFPR